MTDIDIAPLFESRADIEVSADPATVYAVVSDLPRSGEWSPECTGGRWISGEPAEVGAVFRGENLRAADVVAWAPVVRGPWSTESQVVAAEPGRVFRWAMRDTAGRAQQSVWSYEMEAGPHGTRLTHHFRMDAPTEGIRKIIADLDTTQRQRFFAEWGEKVAADLRETLQRVKSVIEKTA